MGAIAYVRAVGKLSPEGPTAFCVLQPRPFSRSMLELLIGRWPSGIDQNPGFSLHCHHDRW